MTFDEEQYLKSQLEDMRRTAETECVDYDTLIGLVVDSISDWDRASYHIDEEEAAAMRWEYYKKNKLHMKEDGTIVTDTIKQDMEDVARRHNVSYDVLVNRVYATMPSLRKTGGAEESVKSYWQTLRNLMTDDDLDSIIGG